MASHERSSSADRSRTASIQNDGHGAVPASSTYKISTFGFNDGSLNRAGRQFNVQDAPQQNGSRTTSQGGRPSNPSPVSDPDVAAALDALARDDETHQATGDNSGM